MNDTPISVIVYRDGAGNEPFTNWLNKLRDPVTRRRILKRLWRLENKFLVIANQLEMV